MFSQSTYPSQLRQASPQKDFKCKCGRAYRSYAAVYTHIRNKHQKNQEYLNSIQRPAWQTNRKGRPKKTSKGFLTKEIEEIHILESGLLKFIQVMQQVLPNSGWEILLKGNQQQSLLSIIQSYDKLQQEYQLDFNILNCDSLNPIYTQIKKFYFKFVQHLNAEISGKILWTLNKLLSCEVVTLNSEILDISFNSTPESILKEVWSGRVEPIQAIIGTFREFIKCSDIQTKSLNDYIEEILDMSEKQQCSSQINQNLIG